MEDAIHMNNSNFTVVFCANFRMFNILLSTGEGVLENGLASIAFYVSWNTKLNFQHKHVISLFHKLLENKRLSMSFAPYELGLSFLAKIRQKQKILSIEPLFCS